MKIFLLFFISSLVTIVQGGNGKGGALVLYSLSKLGPKTSRDIGALCPVRLLAFIYCVVVAHHHSESSLRS